MNDSVLRDYDEALALTGDKIAAASLALAAALRDAHPAAAPAEPPATLTVPEAAERLRVNKQTVYRLCRDGRLPSYKVGSALRIFTEEIERFERENEYGAAPARKAAPLSGIVRYHG